MAVKLVYLASPYSKYPGGRQEAFKLSCEKAAELMRKGEKVFCPIAHSHSIEVEGMFGEIMDGDWWLQQDYAVLYWCSKLYVYQMPGWDQSYGVQKEIDFANLYGIPIEYIPFGEKQNEQAGTIGVSTNG